MKRGLRPEVRVGLSRVVLCLLATQASSGLRPQASVAQDSTGGVRIGITYAPGTRPSLTVVGYDQPPLDSVSAILARDLEQSDRFEMAQAPSTLNNRWTQQLDAAAFNRMGVQLVASLAPDAPGFVLLSLQDPRSGQTSLRLRLGTGAGLRAAVHAAADEIVQAAFGRPGIAATAILFVRNGRIWRVDADGHGAQQLRTAGAPALSPAWSPDGRHFVYTAYVRSGQPLVMQELASGNRVVIPTTEYGLNITPSFAPRGGSIAWARGDEAGTDIYRIGLGEGQQPERLTSGRFADNLSPTWSPDGSRIAFISSRAGSPQLYVMNADGTGQEVLARFDFGATGTTSAPAWSSEGQLIAFHREVGGVPQIFVLDIASRALRQLTGSGRNEDPHWAPDGRHLVFASSRGGARDLWVIDVETGRLRQLTRLPGARLPAWSPRLPH